MRACEIRLIAGRGRDSVCDVPRGKDYRALRYRPQTEALEARSRASGKERHSDEGGEREAVVGEDAQAVVSQKS